MEPAAEDLVTDVNGWSEESHSYAELCDRFRIVTPEFFNMAQATVGRHASGASADSVALVCSDGEDGASGPSPTGN